MAATIVILLAIAELVYLAGSIVYTVVTEAPRTLSEYNERRK